MNEAEAIVIADCNGAANILRKRLVGDAVREAFPEGVGFLSISNQEK